MDPAIIANRWLIIGNPAAGKGKALKQWPKIESLLKKNQIDYYVEFTTGKTKATELAKEGIKKGYRKIIGFGGDGTNNEIINGILDQKIIPSNQILYTLLSIGTGNDWVRSHQIPVNPTIFFRKFKSGMVRFQDVGLATFNQSGQQKKRYFANVAGMAYDAFVVKKIAESNFSFSNKLIYSLYLLRCLFDYSLKKVQIKFEDKHIENYCYSINAGIGRYAGGGMLITPHAKVDDGQFALTVISDISKTGILLNYFRLFNGTIGRHAKVTLYKTAALDVIAAAKKPVFLELDGEFVGETPVSFLIVEKALKIWVPK